MGPGDIFTDKMGGPPLPPPWFLGMGGGGGLSYLATGGNSDFPGFHGRYWSDRSILWFDIV